jgi:hypothetical protein
VHCAKLLGRLGALDFDRQVAELQVAELQVLVAVLKRYPVLGLPVTEATALVRP